MNETSTMFGEAKPVYPGEEYLRGFLATLVSGRESAREVFEGVTMATKKFQLIVDDEFDALLEEGMRLSDRSHKSEVLRDGVKSWVLRLRELNGQKTGGKEAGGGAMESSRERALKVVAGRQATRRSW